MSFIKEFKEFAMKGNVVDLAVGVIIGASFGAIVKSAVDDVMMPPLGYLTGGIDFKDKSWTLTVPPLISLETPKEAPKDAAKDAAKDGAAKEAPKEAPKEAVKEPAKDPNKVVIGWGKFINAVVQFTIQALAIFLLIKLITRKKKAIMPEVPPPPSRDQELLMEIRDLLKSKS